MVDRSQAGEILVELVKTLRVFRVAGHHQGRRSISGTKIGVLQYLTHREARLGELAQRLSLSASVVSRAVDALEADGLVERRSDSADARAFLVSITDRGRQDLADRQRHIAEKFAGVLADWDPSRVAEALELLRQLNIHLEELADLLAADEREERDT